MAPPSPVEAPAIDTARLTLRGHRLDDFAELAAMWSDPIVTRHIGGRPFTEEEIWARLLRYIGHWMVMGFGYWAVRERTSGRFVGDVGLADHRRAIAPPLGDDPEMGWVLAPWAHGQGYATEAVRAVLDWAATRFGARRTVCIIDPGNSASIRVAEKSGYRQIGVATYHGDPTLVFARPA